MFFYPLIEKEFLCVKCSDYKTSHKKSGCNGNRRQPETKTSRNYITNEGYHKMIKHYLFVHTVTSICVIIVKITIFSIKKIIRINLYKKSQKTAICTKPAQSYHQHRTYRQQPIRLRIRRLRVRILLGAPQITADFCGFSLLLLRQPVFVFYAFLYQN